MVVKHRLDVKEVMVNDHEKMYECINNWYAKKEVNSKPTAKYSQYS